MENQYIPYNAKLSKEEIREVFSSDERPYNVITLNDYNNIINSFNKKNEENEYHEKKAQEREKIRLKGLKLTERIKAKSCHHISIYERMKNNKMEKIREKERIDKEWRDLLDKEKEENYRKIKEKQFYTRKDVTEFNKKILESNIIYERQLQVDLRKKRQEIRDLIDKETEKRMINNLKESIELEKLEKNVKKLKDIDAGKQLYEQIIKNKELKRQMKQKEEEEILKDKGVLFDPEKTEEEKREALKKLYEDIDKQIQLKNQMKKQKLEEEQQFEKEILEYNNRKKVNQEKIESIKKNGINKRIKESELLGKTLKWNRREQIEKYCEINGNREPLFTDKNIKERNEQFKKHFIENYKYQLKQVRFKEYIIK